MSFLSSEDCLKPARLERRGGGVRGMYDRVGAGCWEDLEEEAAAEALRDPGAALAHRVDWSAPYLPTSERETFGVSLRATFRA